MRTVGIIGGLGPETTAHFYLEIIRGFERLGATGRPPILTWSVPLPLEIERDLIMHSKGEERYAPLLSDGALRLQNGGADFLVMPCNSLHVFIEQIRASVSIPVLSIVEEASKYLGRQNVGRVGLLATATTVRSGMFQRAMQESGTEIVAPFESDQELLAGIILMIIEGKAGEKERRKLQGIIMRMNVKNVLLACTDLQLLLREMPGITIVDTLCVLASAATSEIAEAKD
jgi:aspartate racemase